MKISEARSALKNRRASKTKKQLARRIVKVADFRNLLARSDAKLIGLRFNPSNKELSAEAKKAKEFKFWTKTESSVKPFARGAVPVEAETAPGLSRMYNGMLEHYGPQGRQVFYAQMRKISPVSKLMRHVFSTLKKIVEAKQKERAIQLRALRAELAQLKKLVDRFEDYRDQKQYARAALELKKIELLL
jgi:hypothetical protein